MYVHSSLQNHSQGCHCDWNPLRVIACHKHLYSTEDIRNNRNTAERHFLLLLHSQKYVDPPPFPRIVCRYKHPYVIAQHLIPEPLAQTCCCNTLLQGFQQDFKNLAEGILVPFSPEKKEGFFLWMVVLLVAPFFSCQLCSCFQTWHWNAKKPQND